VFFCFYLATDSKEKTEKEAMKAAKKKRPGPHKRRYLEEITIVFAHAGRWGIEDHEDKAHVYHELRRQTTRIKSTLEILRYSPQLVFHGTEPFTVAMAQNVLPEGGRARFYAMPELNVPPEGPWVTKWMACEEVREILKISEKLAVRMNATLEDYLDEDRSEALRTYCANVLRKIAGIARRAAPDRRTACVLIVTKCPLAVMMMYDLVNDREFFVETKPGERWAYILRRGKISMIETPPC